MPNYRSGTNVTATKTTTTFSYTYATALPAGSYGVNVDLYGLQNVNFGGNTTMPMIVVTASTNTGFSFQIMDADDGTALTTTLTSLKVDFTATQQSL
jgi:hypothetical protein